MKIGSILLLMFCHIVLIGQNDSFVVNIAYKLQYRLTVNDAEIYQLMNIIENDSYNDSVRVDAVHILNKINCDTCTRFLINHINDYFNYGYGISELDQMNSMACWSVLINRHATGYVNSPPDLINERWRLFSLCLLSLQESERDENFLALLIGVFSRTTSKEALKMILIDEKKRNLIFFQPRLKVYDINLNKILQLLN